MTRHAPSASRLFAVDSCPSGGLGGAAKRAGGGYRPLAGAGLGPGGLGDAARLLEHVAAVVQEQLLLRRPRRLHVPLRPRRLRPGRPRPPPGLELRLRLVLVVVDAGLGGSGAERHPPEFFLLRVRCHRLRLLLSVLDLLPGEDVADEGVVLVLVLVPVLVPVLAFVTVYFIDYARLHPPSECIRVRAVSVSTYVPTFLFTVKRRTEPLGLFFLFERHIQVLTAVRW
mmetsp:Transcript_13351/g.28349  ORF Transcript_13351/g.28349 Transcript_13351/m.28349 type:complete len:227 (-) Transcript_13351:371-1051(-)